VLKVKVSQQFTFSGAAGCAVPSLSQVQVEVLKVKVSPTVHFCYAVGLKQVTAKLVNCQLSSARISLRNIL
jgi:hypothetical protein